jgi:hypothetical protein
MAYYQLASQGTNCGGAVAPVKGSGPGSVTFTPGTGTAPTLLLEQTAGSPALNHDVIVENPSCYPATVTVTYLDGADCEPCTPDSVTLVTRTHDLPGFTGLKLDAPGVWISKVEVALDNAVPAAGADATITASGWSVAECPACRKLVP